MLKDYKKAAIGGILLWVLIFLGWSLIIFIPGIKDATEMTQFIVHYILLILWTWIVAKMYFSKVTASVKEGIIVGIFMLIIGIILDAIITVPFVVEPSHGEFFGDWKLWIGFVELIILMAIFGSIMSKKDSKEMPAPESAQSASQPMAGTEAPPSSPIADTSASEESHEEYKTEQ